MADYSAVIGLEIHVQLDTTSKMFCRCSNNSEGAEPNTNTCPVCMGYPGTLPVPNRQAVEWALKTALALQCKVPAVSKFDRKQYFYPDLPKGYQISQYDEPFGEHGSFEFDLVSEDGSITPQTIGITRIHLEEDAGKLTHPKGAGFSLVDLNRAGTPLMEIVTDPVEIASPEDAPVIAKTFLQELRLLMRYLGVSQADMEKGHLRADANISLHPKGSKDWGAKVELKNINSFKFVERGLKAEIARQSALLDAGEVIGQETRGFNEDTGETVGQRSKEEAQDYRYFPEPDIPPLEPPGLGLDSLKETLPELPVARRRRWREQSVSEQLVEVAAQRPEEASELDVSLDQDVALVSKTWLSSRESFAKPKQLGEFVREAVAALEAGTIDSSQVKKLAEKVSQSGQSVKEVLASDSAFKQMDQADLAKIIDEAIAANPQAVEDIKKGNDNARMAIVGAVMKATKGSANPTTVQQLLAEKLEQ